MKSKKMFHGQILYCLKMITNVKSNNLINYQLMVILKAYKKFKFFNDKLLNNAVNR
jgi:hypothetical protein